MRTLHHYDAIGLLPPSGRSEAGYRTYVETDLSRLRLMLFYRELEFSLNQIASLLDRGSDPAMHVRRQHDLLNARVARLKSLAASVNHELEARSIGISLTAEERFDVFGVDNPEQYAEEVRERWGDTDAFGESRARSSGYEKADWLKIKEETNTTEQGLAALLAEGKPATSPEAMDLAERLRKDINRWFFDCDVEMHRGLAELYVSDPRFAVHYEEIAPGLAQFVHDAILANSDRTVR